MKQTLWSTCIESFFRTGLLMVSLACVAGPVAAAPAATPEGHVHPPMPDAVAPTEKIELFNGKNLDNWFADLPRGGTKDEVWAVKDGVIRCAGNPRGHLITRDAYKDYRVELEWRWLLDSKPGNNGLLVHSSDARVLGNMFPRSIEVQLQNGQAGDFWVIGADITVPDMEKRRKGRHIWNLTDGSEKPVGEWNTMVVHCRGDEIKVWVNGDLVNHGTGSTVTEGRITLQSEGAACQYRRLTLLPLPDKDSFSGK